MNIGGWVVRWHKRWRLRGPSQAAADAGAYHGIRIGPLEVRRWWSGLTGTCINTRALPPGNKEEGRT